MDRRLSSLLGAGFGLVLFLAIALLPAMLYGGYAGVLLASGIFGSPITPTLAVKTVIIGGMILGTLSVASLFTVVGAVIGGGVYTLTSLSDMLKPSKLEN
jgi:hypothetical protein